MTREEIMDAMETTDWMDSRFDGAERLYLYLYLYLYHIDDLSVVEWYAKSGERVVMVPKDGTITLHSLDDLDSVELVDIAEAYE